MRSGLSVGAWVVLILAVALFRRVVVMVVVAILAILVLAWAFPGLLPHGYGWAP